MEKTRARHYYLSRMICPLVTGNSWKSTKSVFVLSTGPEDLFSGREDTLRGLFAFLEEEPPRRDLVEGVLAGRLNRQQEGLFPVYEEWDEQRRERLFSIAGDTMARLGYRDS